MSFLDLAWKRRSVRSFKEDDIPMEIINELLEAARSAPSAGNYQPWHFYIIKDKALKEGLCAAAYQQNFMLSAPVHIVVCADLVKSAVRYGVRGTNLYAIQDTAAAIQNLLLYATEKGLGTCWCGAFDEQKVSKLLNLKSERPVAIIPIGYPRNLSAKMPRRSIEEISTFIGF
jgi:nitroreductase